MKSPRRLHVTWGRTSPMACPGCHAALNAATGFSPTDRVVPEVGCQTLCDHCFTWCTFVYEAFPTPGLRLRLATRDEIAQIDPTLRDLAVECAAFLSRDDRKQ